MSSRNIKLLAFGAAVLITLSGCTTMAQPSRFSYFKAPCDAPGAFRAQPVDQSGNPIARDQGQALAQSAANAPASDSVCLVAVSDTRYAQSSAYYGYPRYYFYPGYRGSYNSGFGIGIGFGRARHFGGGHRSGGHRGAGHNGGQHDGGRH